MLSLRFVVVTAISRIRRFSYVFAVLPSSLAIQTTQPYPRHSTANSHPLSTLNSSLPLYAHQKFSQRLEESSRYKRPIYTSPHNPHRMWLSPVPERKNKLIDTNKDKAADCG